MSPCSRPSRAVEAGVVAVASPFCVIWGAGLHTESLYQLTTLFRRQPDRHYVLIDSDPVKQGTTWRGIPVYAPNAVLHAGNADWSETDLLISSYGDQAAMVEAARASRRARTRGSSRCTTPTRSGVTNGRPETTVAAAGR